MPSRGPGAGSAAAKNIQPGERGYIFGKISRNDRGLLGWRLLPEPSPKFENVQNELRRTNEELVEAREFFENVLEGSTRRFP